MALTFQAAAAALLVALPALASAERAPPAAIDLASEQSAPAPARAEDGADPSASPKQSAPAPARAENDADPSASPRKDAAADAGARSSPAEAAVPAPEADAAAEAEALLHELTPPAPIGSIEVPWPKDAPAPDRPIEVQVLLRIDEQGAVTEVEILQGAGAPWDDAVIEAARGFRFEPARLRGEPVAVEIPFVQRFTAPDPPPSESAAPEVPAFGARLVGEVIEMGTRRPVPHPAVIAVVGGRRYRADGDPQGRFSLPLPSGDAQIEVEVPGYLRFVVDEKIAPGQELEVRYLVQRQSHHPFEQVVIGRAARQEVTRTTLRDRELHRVPGTFGDPFRVVGTLPGVGQVFSLLDYPIIRGASPGSSGLLLDGDPIPQLFHFLAGPAVLHPYFIDRIDFYPGAFPLEYGGYTGGIVDGITRAALPDERRIEVGIDLMKSDLLVRQPMLGATATVAGRYGYPGLLLRAVQPDAFLSYWDYQLRLDGGGRDGRWTVFAFGSFDEFGEVQDGRDEVAMQMLFHRLSLRWTRGDDANFDRYELGIGYDRSRSGSEPVDGSDLIGEDEEEDSGIGYALTEWMLHPRARWRRPLGEGIAIHGGLNLKWRRTSSTFEIEDEEEDLLPGAWTLQVGAFAETPWWITDDLLLRPGMRFDVWETDTARRFSIDPRMNLRWRADHDEQRSIWLKGGVGIFHQPPRLPISIPGVAEVLLEEGLPAAVQTTVGAEIDWATGWFVDVQTYFNYMDPIFLDLEVNGTNAENPEGYGENLRQGLTGRSYGAEVLLRRRAIGPFFGWISYTLSRSERLAPDGWKAFDFDRTHMLQVVGSLRLPRDWELGARFQAVSGRPVNPWDEATRRARTFTRLDLRIDRRVVYRSWMLDFYVELINTMITREQVSEDADASIPYIFPTIGFRAVL